MIAPATMTVPRIVFVSFLPWATVFQSANSFISPIPFVASTLKPRSALFMSNGLGDHEEAYDVKVAITRRDSIAAAFTAAVLTPAMAFAAEEQEGRLIRFDVANLDGVEGNTGSFTIRTHPSWAPEGVRRFEVRVIV